MPPSATILCCLLFLAWWNMREAGCNDVLVVGTWDSDGFQGAVQASWNALAANSDRMTALVAGLSECERRQCDYTVGWGGSPDENAQTTLDALVMDGGRHAVGAVAQLRRVRDAARVAWAVLNHTAHTLLVGEDATQFALKMGFREESLSSNRTKNMYKKWIENKCQPNFWRNVVPNAAESCGPYKPPKTKRADRTKLKPAAWSRHNHDTLGLIVLDQHRFLAAGTSSNGATFKIPGRVGDAPIPGAGAYANTEGAAVATGDGDIMMRFLPSFAAVDLIGRGVSPELAARTAVESIHKYHPGFFGAVVAANSRGEYGAACSGMPVFRYSVNRQPLPSSADTANVGRPRNDTFLVEVYCR